MNIEKRLAEIRARKAEIRSIIEKDDKADMDALEKELRELNEEAEGLERRQNIERMFASGSLELQTDDKTAEVHAALHGATLDELEEELTDSDSDVAPRGGLAYYKVLIRNGVRVYQGVFHPLVNAILGNDSAATKGSSITFGTSTTTFTVFRCNSGAWRIRKEFSSEADVIAWCDEKLGDTGT